MVSSNLRSVVSCWCTQSCCVSCIQPSTVFAGNLWFESDCAKQRACWAYLGFDLFPFTQHHSIYQTNIILHISRTNSNWDSYFLITDALAVQCPDVKIVALSVCITIYEIIIWGPYVSVCLILPFPPLSLSLSTPAAAAALAGRLHLRARCLPSPRLAPAAAASLAPRRRPRLLGIFPSHPSISRYSWYACALRLAQLDTVEERASEKRARARF
jgi:hypothetical protein